MSEKENKIPNHVLFITGGIAGCGAVTFVHPIDLVKARMQVSGEGGKMRDHRNSLSALKNIVKNEGFMSLYSGFSANVTRQMFYTMTRLGLFQIVTKSFQRKKIEFEGIKAQAAAGLIAGGIASVMSTPVEVSLVRMIVDGRLPVNEQRKYKHVFDAVYRISKEEGVLKLWTGAVASVSRAMLGNVAQLVPYVQTKRYLLRNGMSDDFACHFLSSLLAGFTYASSTCPLDLAKTRMQSMKTINGVPEYAGVADVWMRTVKNEGLFALWKGFGPYYGRIAPFTILMFVFVEQLMKMYRIYFLGESGSKGAF